MILPFDTPTNIEYGPCLSCVYRKFYNLIMLRSDTFTPKL